MLGFIFTEIELAIKYFGYCFLHLPVCSLYLSIFVNFILITKITFPFAFFNLYTFFNFLLLMLFTYFTFTRSHSHPQIWDPSFLIHLHYTETSRSNSTFTSTSTSAVMRWLTRTRLRRVAKNMCFCKHIKWLDMTHTTTRNLLALGLQSMVLLSHRFWSIIPHEAFRK